MTGCDIATVDHTSHDRVLNGTFNALVRCERAKCNTAFFVNSLKIHVCESSLDITKEDTVQMHISDGLDHDSYLVPSKEG